jgi:hypothetical protein
MDGTKHIHSPRVEEFYTLGFINQLLKPMDTVAPRRLNRRGAKGEGWLILKMQQY